MPNLTTVTALINGVTVNLTKNANGTWSGTGTAPSGSSYPLVWGYYPVEVTASYDTGTSTTVDDQTSGSVGQGCRFFVKEKAAPKVTYIFPTNNTTITDKTQEKINFSVTDKQNSSDAGYSGIKQSSIYAKLTPSSGSDIIIQNSEFTFTAITDGSRTAGYTALYIPTEETALSDGNYTLTVYCEDYDGNTKTSTPISFVIDTVAPSLSISAPEQNFATAETTISVTGTTSDAISDTVTVTVTLNDGTPVQAAVDSSGNFSASVTFVEEGAQTITVIATDSAGNSTSSTVEGYYSNAAPNITNVVLVPNPADAGATYTITVTVV